MAVIKTFRREVIGRGSRHATDVDGVYFDFLDEGGTRILQLSTLGSEHRQSKPKVSQTIQIGPDAARELARILDEVFSLNLDVGPGAGSAAVPAELDLAHDTAAVEAHLVWGPLRSHSVPWIDQLFASPTYREQRALAGRAGVDDDVVGAVLNALVGMAGHGPLDVVERQAGLRPGSLRALVPPLRRLLNVDGYEVLALDHGLLLLDDVLLRHQFEIEGVALGEGDLL